MVTNTEDDEDSLEDPIDYKSQYRNFKRKLKLLIYENECFQEALRSNQRRMLKVTRDRSFLLDRLLNYEKVEGSSSGGDETDSSEDEAGRGAAADARRRPASSSDTSAASKPPPPPPPPPPKKKKTAGGAGRTVKAASSEERAEARRQMMDLDRTPLPVPSDMFSNEPSLDSESNDMCDLDPAHSPTTDHSASSTITTTTTTTTAHHCLNNEYILPD